MKIARSLFSFPIFIGLFLFPVIVSTIHPASLPVPIPLAAEREEVNLNGTWDMAVTDKADYPPQVKNWQASRIPALNQGNAIQGTRYVWYRREIETPASFAGKRIGLTLYGARFNATVFCDGNRIASRLEGYTPFSIDLTNKVKPGGRFLLEIRCQDWSAVFKDGYKLPSDADPNGETLRGVPNGKIIAPIGGHFDKFGIWDDVALTALPAAYCDNITIVTSVRNNDLLTISGKAVGEVNGLWIEGEVRDGEEIALAIPGRKIGVEAAFVLSIPFPKPRYWSPEDPHRYTLVLYLKNKKDGIVVDRYKERFGFRELWTEGPDFVLNGVRRHLLASAGWPVARYQSPEEIRQAIADIKASNAVGFRLHTQPWQRRWLEEADDLGLMIVEEGALWCDGGGGYAYEDDRFWENVDAHLAGMVRRDRNHPSLVMWSVENELLHCGASGKCACAEPRLAEAGRKVKALDPNHLITYEADHDPGGVADVIGLHYPREMPDHTDYPNTADWLGTTVKTGTAGGTAGSWNEDFFWDRKKPLYIGEYLWVFQQDYSPGSVFYGDESYLDAAAFRDRAKAQAWVFQTVAYRRAGVSGMCPWTIADEGGKIDKTSPLFAAQKEAYDPVAVFPREYDSRFFAGEKVIRTFDVFNDSPRQLKLETRFTMAGWEAGYTETFTLEPAGHKLVKVTVPLPAKSAPDGLQFNASLYTGGKKVNAYDTRYFVFDKIRPVLPEGRKLAVFDPAGKWQSGLLIAGSVGIKKLDGLSAFDPGKTLLVIGPNAFVEPTAPTVPQVIGLRNTAADIFRSFLDRGGRALVLEQETLSPLMPVLGLVDHPSTVTFAVSPSHPLLAGLDADALKFWRGDNYVSRKEIRRPTRFGASAVIVSGGIDVCDQAPIVEMPVGRGRVVFCQALAGAKYDEEPAARRFVANALAWLASYKDSSRAALLVIGNDGAEFGKRLGEIGLALIEPAAQVKKGDVDNTDFIVLHGGGKKIEALAPFFAGRVKPLTVYWHAPDKDSFEKLKSILGLENASITPATGPLSLTESGDPAVSGLLREDVTYLKPFTPANWYRVIEPEPEVIDRVLSIDTPGKSRVYDLKDWQVSGAFVNRTADGSLAFYTNGTASGKIDIKQEGLYQFRIEAWGTPADGGWPLVLVKSGGLPVGTVSVTARSPKFIPFLARLDRGLANIEVSFVNDYYKNDQDRNLFIRSMSVSREPVNAKGLALLALPPALVMAETKSGLRTIIDCVRWDTNTDNRVRGLRYASTLLANLGAAFTAGNPSPDWIHPPAFEIHGEISVFSRTDAQLFFGSNGLVETTFTCATAGEYAVVVRGFATPAQGIYGKARVKIDGRLTGEPELSSSVAAEFPAGTVRLDAGSHELAVEFTNDLWLGPGKEDRNLYVTGVGLLWKEK